MCAYRAILSLQDVAASEYYERRRLFMDFFNIPEPPSFERVQNDYSQKQIDLLNEIKTVQQDQAKLLNQMEKASSKDKKWLVISTISSVIAAIGTIIGIVIPLF